MRVKIYGLSVEAFERLKRDLSPAHWRKDSYLESDGLYYVTLEESVMIKNHFDSIAIDCGGHLSSIEAGEFVEVRII